MEAHRVAAVSEDAMSIARLFIEAQTHAVHVRQIGKLARVHHLCRFRLQDLSTLILPVLQMGDHEVSHVHRGHGGASGW